jgi:NADH-quinone oxidoreductase subunit J
MSFELLAFYAFAAITVMSALAVVSVKNPVHAVLFLVLTFFSTACLWLLAEAEFLGIALVLVYVGAVMVLFLFVVMMLDIQSVPNRGRLSNYLPVALVVAIVMGLEMLALIGVGKGQGSLPADPALMGGMSNTEWIGHALFTDYLLPFELAAVILTVAIIAAIMLTLRQRTGVKHQNPTRQVQVRKEDRIRILKMPSERQEGRRRDSFRHQCGGHFCQPEKHYRSADGDRVDAARGEYQFRGVLAASGGSCGSGVRFFHPYRCCCRVSDRSCHLGDAVP